VSVSGWHARTKIASVALARFWRPEAAQELLNRRLVVLIHGYTAPAAAWASTTDALVNAGYRVIGFDRRCHGESKSPVFGQRMARQGRDIGEFLENLDLNDVTLVGASMGGNAIWASIDQFGPNRVRAVRHAASLH
jgi:pimeloyl-ACP methyl ester carboxylesterase